ncbi:DUF6457 domain-containing protein [Streptomyces pathocidini]|uniref:DUF6457 domain-containing protein n=1 Tax=Streptomyces pathocidini TaxID=1650571 RepID=A0ABW7URN6_9ACTN|nr:DUF6457 domain-containing protein [Streptomyces pathocidini]
MTAHVYDAVVLAGGAAKRLGGADKPGLRVGGRPLLDRVLAACAEASATVVVGSRRPTARPVRWAREEPPGGGPLAALDAGLRHVTAPVVLALSADLPFLSVDTVRALLTALDASEASGGSGTGTAPAGSGSDSGGGVEAGGSGGSVVAPDARADGVVLVDHSGRDQPLVAAYRAEPLRRELALLAAEHGRLAHLPLRLLTDELTLARLPVPEGAAGADSAVFDCDTWEDLAAARARIREHGNVLDEWMAAVKDELGIELDVDTGALLDLARDAAHGVARPAAPLTTFLVGYAAGRAGEPEEVAVAARKAAALAARWAEEEPEGTGESGGSDGTGASGGSGGSGSANGPEKRA